MNIQQLRDYLNALLASGADPFMPVCTTSDEEASEVSDIVVVDGPFREDPSPKMPAFLNSKGTFVFLATSDDYDWMAHDRYRTLNGPEVPAKEWKAGQEWWLRDREATSSERLTVIAGKVGSTSKVTQSFELPSIQGFVAMQVEHSGDGAKPISTEDPTEFPVAWKPQRDVGHNVRTRVYVGGVPEDEHKRLQMLPRRGLTPEDIPNEPWREHYSEYLLREDGAILANGLSLEVGWINATAGTVNWVRLQGAQEEPNTDLDLNIDTARLDEASKSVLRKLKAHGFDKAGVEYLADSSLISANEFSQFFKRGYGSRGAELAVFSDYASPDASPHVGKASFRLNFNLV